MSNNLVGYSRAGDVFHYRWAARRCLRMIYPKSNLKLIVIEGSNEDEKSGEYVIDVAEYYDGPDNKDTIHYNQLKHSTVQLDSPFKISDLKETFKGFSDRFKDLKGSGKYENISELHFKIVTNREVDSAFKNNVLLLAQNTNADKRFTGTIKKYTELDGQELNLFCSLIRFEDREGDYNAQKDELRVEIERLSSGVVDNSQVASIEAMIKDKVLPDSDGIISRENILYEFGITNIKQLYPAPGSWEYLEKIITRNQYTAIKSAIHNANHPVIVHADGGIGKSVFCQHFINSIPENSFGIAYDCFGAGSYRRLSETRHRHQDALVQIVNELASRGYCDPLIPSEHATIESIMKSFLIRIKETVRSLKLIEDSAQLFILIDAADNSEMAAAERNQSCFASELIREQMPTDCKFVFLCRTERIHLLKPLSEAVKIELEGFDKTESLSNLRVHFPDVSIKEGTEFHRLTNGNPRVQAYALDQNLGTVLEVLESFGVSGGTVDEQIGLQLASAVNKIKDELPPEFETQINSLCTGLASLPPFIPINILAKASGVSEHTIKGFIADIGRSLWLTDSSVQFRDEPTETWFRETYIASKAEIIGYIKELELFAMESSYVAEVLPQLYLQAEQYDKLIDIALSDKFLPENNPIETRNIRVYRLQFAFKAALKINRFDDAVKLAMRAGEEVAGNQRQLNLFHNNIDLLIKFQDEQKIQELAFKRILRNHWPGSENVFTASLLSGVDHFQGEAQSFLRSASNWLDLFFQEKEKRKELETLQGRTGPPSNLDIENDDIVELATSHLNINGIESCLSFLNKFKPKEWIFNVVKELVNRLIDAGEFEVVNKMLELSKNNSHFVVAITSELMQIGMIPEPGMLKKCLTLLTKSKTKLKRANSYFNDGITPSILYFLEACLSKKLSPNNISKVLNFYVPKRGTRAVYDSFLETDRSNFLRALAIRKMLSPESEIQLESIIPESLITKKSNGKIDGEIDKFIETINKLFSWSLFRLNTIIDGEALLSDFESVQIKSNRKKSRDHYRTHDTIPNEICSICCSVLIFSSKAPRVKLEKFFKKQIKDSSGFNISEHINLLRASNRALHLSFLNSQLEELTYQLINSNLQDETGEISNRYINLSRAVLINSLDDARIYFEDAINVVSKFGDELTERWSAVVSLTERVNIKNESFNELAYRFIRCAEVVGEDTREKHWDRSKAIAICTRLSKGVGISSLSRWRERDIGRFEWMLYAQIKELLKSTSISPSIAWSLSKFLDEQQRVNKDYIDFFLEKEKSPNVKKFILDDLVGILQKEGAGGSCWLDLSEKASFYSIKNVDLSAVVNNIEPSLKKEHKYIDRLSNDLNDIQWNEVFINLDILTLGGIESCIKKHEEFNEQKQFYLDPHQFWKEVLKRAGEGNLWGLIDNVLMSEKTERYDLQRLLIEIMSTGWLKKVSAKKKWPEVIRRVGQKLARDLSEPYGFKYFLERLNFDQSLIKSLKTGICEGLSQSTDNLESSHFFGFVELASSFVPSEKMVELVDYSISRFEIHVEDEYGDGQWGNWLKPPDNVYESIAMFIWTALGTPKMSVRWNAAHCVKTLIELDCIEVIDALVSFLDLKEVGAFNCSKYPFYNLHAQQYLLIAFARSSLDKIDLLKQHFEVFSKCCMSNEHIIIQKFSSDIAINIETKFPGTYKSTLIKKIKAIYNSPFPIQEEDYNYVTDSYFHKNGLVQNDRDYHFAWDFDSYWFEPLGKVFGISGKQVADIAAEVTIDQWGVSKTGYNNDPRVGLWNQSHDRETWHDHGSYPSTDNFDFYLSYHAMMVTASKLLKKMPVVKHKDWQDNEWIDWLSDHLITRSDGKWLSDHRDPLPIKRPSWLKLNEEDWINNIIEDQFVEAIVLNDNDETWLNIGGGWSERGGEKAENFHISSALVSSATANSLMNALATCDNPHDYKLPNFDEERTEINSPPFNLKGWIYKEHFSEGLDKFDQYAGGVGYPHFSIGDDIVKEMSLTMNEDGKYFYSNISDKPSIVCSSWSSEKPRRDESADQSGETIKASLQFLLELCKTLDLSLIFEVQISRNKDSRFRDSEEKYRYPLHKIYILLENGTLKSTKKDYRLW